eukprot:m.706044 g.706044  ORF g.706044 m.706044 type:complete len:898 (+) comp58724_c0_seq3:180-2873(+)
MAAPGEELVVGRYRSSMRRSLGRGAFGEVFKGDDTLTKNYVAIKVMKDSIIRVQHASTYTKLMSLMAGEVQLLKKLDDPSICKLLEFERVTRVDGDKWHCYVFEMCEGDVDGLLRTRKSLCDKDTRALVTGMLRALQVMRHNSVVHRDIKPQNILYRAQPNGDLQFKLADFGLARNLRGADDLARTSCGTAQFAAPELGLLNRDLSQAYSFEVDTWSMGATLLHIILRKSVFDICPAAKLPKEFKPDLYFPFLDSAPIQSRGLKQALKYLTRCMMQLHPKQRAPTSHLSELAKRFEPILFRDFVTCKEYQVYCLDAEAELGKFCTGVYKCVLRDTECAPGIPLLMWNNSARAELFRPDTLDYNRLRDQSVVFLDTSALSSQLQHKMESQHDPIMEMNAAYALYEWCAGAFTALSQAIDSERERFRQEFQKFLYNSKELDPQVAIVSSRTEMLRLKFFGQTSNPQPEKLLERVTKFMQTRGEFSLHVGFVRQQIEKFEHDLANFLGYHSNHQALILSLEDFFNRVRSAELEVDAGFQRAASARVDTPAALKQALLSEVTKFRLGLTLFLRDNSTLLCAVRDFQSSLSFSDYVTEGSLREESLKIDTFTRSARGLVAEIDQEIYSAQPSLGPQALPVRAGISPLDQRDAFGSSPSSSLVAEGKTQASVQLEILLAHEQERGRAAVAELEELRAARQRHIAEMRDLSAQCREAFAAKQALQQQQGPQLQQLLQLQQQNQDLHQQNQQLQLKLQQQTQELQQQNQQLQHQLQQLHQQFQQQAQQLQEQRELAQKAAARPVHEYQNVASPVQAVPAGSEGHLVKGLQAELDRLKQETADLKVIRSEWIRGHRALVELHRLVDPETATRDCHCLGGPITADCAGKNVPRALRAIKAALAHVSQ